MIAPLLERNDTSPTRCSEIIDNRRSRLTYVSIARERDSITPNAISTSAAATNSIEQDTLDTRGPCGFRDVLAIPAFRWLWLATDRSPSVGPS
jgi:hypothetical protein